MASHMLSKLFWDNYAIRQGQCRKPLAPITFRKLQKKCNDSSNKAVNNWRLECTACISEGDS